MVGRPAEPGEVRERCQLGDRRLVAVEQEAGEHHGTGDARGRPPADEGRQRERERPGDQRGEPQPRGKPECGLDRDLVAGQRPEGACGGRGDEHEHHRQREHHDVAGDLLDRDPPAGHRRSGEDLHAAPPDFDGERGGQGEDRPQRRDQREEPAVLVLDVATQRFDVDRPSGQARQDRRNGGHQVADLLARLGGRELGRDRLRDDHQQHADEQRDGDRRPTRIADGLAEDAAQAEDPAAQVRCDERCRGLRLDGCGHRVMPPRPACSTGRTRRGTSPRGTARATRSRSPRGARRRARPG